MGCRGGVGAFFVQDQKPACGGFPCLEGAVLSGGGGTKPGGSDGAGGWDSDRQAERGRTGDARGSGREAHAYNMQHAPDAAVMTEVETSRG